MERAKTPGRIQTSRLTRVMGALSRGAFDRPVLTIAALALLTTGLWLVAPPLQINTDMTALLSEDAPSVRSLERLERRVGGMGYVTVVVEGQPKERLKAYVDRLEGELRGLESIRSVTTRRPTAFFEARALFYLPEANLDAFARSLDARVAWEKLHSNPFYIDLEDSEPPALRTDLLRPDALAHWLPDESIAEAHPQPYYLDEAKGTAVLFARPNGFASDVAFADRVVAQVREKAEGLQAREFRELQVGLTGRFTKRMDQNRQFTDDMKTASSWAFLLVLGFVVLIYRRPVILGLLFAPLMMGLVHTYLFAAFGLGSLNILTGLIFGILAGLGIDYGIHLIDAYGHHYADVTRPEDAVSRAYEQTARAVLLAALTTTAGFLALAFSDFRGFHEFGLVAGVGVALLMANYVLLLPALIALAHRFGWRPLPRPRMPTRIASVLARSAPMWLALGVVLATTVVLRGAAVRFDFDTGTIQGSTLPSFALAARVDELTGHGQVPTLLFPPHRGDEAAVVQALRNDESRSLDASQNEAEASPGTPDPPVVDFVVARNELVPSHQERKATILERMRPQLKEAAAFAEREDAAHLETLARLAEAKPFTEADLPHDLRTLFGWDRDAQSDEGLVLVYPAIDLADGLEVIRMTEALRASAGSAVSGTEVASESVVFADVLSLIRQEIPFISLATIVAILLALVIALGSLWRGASAMLAPTGTMLLLFAVMALSDIPFNYLNIILIPILIGVGVDGGIHMLEGLREHGSLGAALNQQGRAIANAVITTALGFVPLIFIDHPGLSSIGIVATIGLACNLVACLGALPAVVVGFLKLRETVRRERRSAA